ncbi:MAG: hypothetical protein WBJ75_11250 [Pseudohongiellaceae bacterium]|nr:MAG: hypothetical protein A3H44_12345 [Gammaproteobacteria bacterium RIFCSPLOWO2_02_FULL_57_10]
MKSHQWDEIADPSKDFFDSGAFIPETELEEPNDKRLHKRRLTELRRKTEERLDWKRMYGDLQFDDDNDDVNFKDTYDVDDFDDFDDALDDH